MSIAKSDAVRRLATVIAALAITGPAHTQPTPRPTFGPPIAGECVFDRGRALVQSLGGRSVDEQIAHYHTTVKISAAFDSQHRVTVGAGVGYEF